MAERRTCPGCQSVMQTFRAEGVEIERCFFCGGFFFDADELQSVSGRPLPLEGTGSESARRCAACGATMYGATLGEITVETCGTCAGLYLDAGELEHLAGREIDLERVAPVARDKVTMKCVVCREEIDVDLGVTTMGGFACGPCAPLAERKGSSNIPGVLPSAVGMRSVGPQIPGAEAVHTASSILLTLRSFLGF